MNAMTLAGETREFSMLMVCQIFIVVGSLVRRKIKPRGKLEEILSKIKLWQKFYNVHVYV